MESDSLPQAYKAFVSKEGDLPRRLIEIPLRLPGDDQVLVKISFAPLNQTDLVTSEGKQKISIRSPFLVGLESSGVVVAIGSNLKVPHKVGDKVHVHSKGSHAQYVLAYSQDVSEIKGDLSMEEAASHIINPATVAYMVSLAVRGGHKAVVNTAASSQLGKMLIRALKEKGIKSINTARSDKYIEELKQEGADYVLNSESADFEARLKDLAAKEEATVAFDAINGDFTDKLVSLLPANSTVHVYGSLGGVVKYRLIDEIKFDDNKTVSGLFYLTYIGEFKQRGELAKFYEEIHTSLKTTFRSEVHKIYPVDEILEAIAYYEKNSSKGKILIKYN